MKLLSKLILFALLGVMFSTTSCKKYAGPGGKASIEGTLLGIKYDGAGNVLATYPLMKHDVYIIYGDDMEQTIPDDDMESSYDGSFAFKFLNKGVYRIFTYAKCPSCASGDTTLLYTVEITDKTQVVDLGTIEVRD